MQVGPREIANMATAARANKETECRVCGEDYIDPKILPCGHLLCRDCIASRLSSATEAACPQCECAIVTSEERRGQSLAEIADALPTDLAMESLVDSMQVLGQEHSCCVCAAPAVCICLNCLDLLCGPCQTVHQKLTATRYHVVEHVAALTPESLASRRPAFCYKHGDRRADHFCGGHEVALCSACAVAEHQACHRLGKMEDVMKAADSSLANLRDRLNGALRQVEETLSHLDDCLREADSREEAAVVQVDKACDLIHALVEASRQKSKEFFQNALASLKDALLAEKASLAHQRRKLKAQRHLVERARRRTPHHRLKDMETPLTKHVNGLDLACNLPAHLNAISLPRMIIDAAVVQEIEKLLNKMGRLEDGDQAPVFVFHENRGTNIRLTNCKMTAERTQPEESFGNGVVVSRDAMAENVLYEVRVAAVGDFHWNTLTLGVTGTPPAQLVVTMWSEDLEDSIIIRHSGVSRQGKIFKVNYGLALKKIQVGSRVGVLVGSSNDLHLYVNGQDQGVAAENVPQPCFAIFDVCNRVIQVTALPTSRIT